MSRATMEKVLPWLQVGAVVFASIYSAGAGAILAGAFGLYNYERWKSSANLVADQQGMQVNTTSNENALPIIYGLAKVGMSTVDVRQSVNDTNILAVVGAIAIAPESGNGISSIEKVYFDEEEAIAPVVFGTNSSGNNPITDNVQSPWSGSGTFGIDYFLEYFGHDGDDDQTVDYKLSSGDQGWSPDPWLATARGRGVAYIVLWLYLDDEKYSNGLPNITFEVKGMKVKDVTDLSVTARYSTNPADCIWDFMTSTRYGMGIPAYQMDATSFSDAAAYCDEEVTVTLSTGTATLPDRFTCNGWLDSSAGPLTNLQRLLSSCQGRVVREGGKYKLLIRQVKSAETAFELNRTNIVGEWSFVRTGVNESPNVITATYVDADRSYQPDRVTFPGPGSANTYLAADNDYQVEGEIELPFTTSRYMAEMITAQTLLEGRADMACAVVAQREALRLAVGDVVNVNHDTPAWTDQTMWVEEIGLRRDGLVQLVMKEYLEATYAVPTMPVKDTLVSSDAPPRYVTSPTSRVQVQNLIVTPLPAGEDASDNQYWTANMDIQFGPGVSSYKVRHQSVDSSNYDYTYTVASPTLTGQHTNTTLQKDGSTDPYEFSASISGATTTYPEASLVTVTPYPETSAGGTAGNSMSERICIDGDTGAVGVRAQETGATDGPIIPGTRLLVPETGGLTLAVDSDTSNPAISLSIPGVATGTATSSGTDYLIYYDADAGALRKIDITGLPYEPLS